MSEKIGKRFVKNLEKMSKSEKIEKGFAPVPEKGLKEDSDEYKKILVGKNFSPKMSRGDIEKHNKNIEGSFSWAKNKKLASGGVANSYKENFEKK